MCKGSILYSSAFGAVIILIVALSNSSCCSHRKVVEHTKAEKVEHVTTSSKGSEEHTRHQEATLTRETRSRGATVTEIEIYDTEKQPDPETGQRPLKVKIRQIHGDEHLSNEAADITTEDKIEKATESEQTIDSSTLDEVMISAPPPSSLWKRFKQGAAWAVVIMILTVAMWIIYKLKK